MAKDINWPGMTNAALAARLEALAKSPNVRLTADESQAIDEAITRLEEAGDSDDD